MLALLQLAVMATFAVLPLTLAFGGYSSSHTRCPATGASSNNESLGTLLHNRISPNYSELYIANADGSNERLLLGNESVFDFRASWSADGRWVTFTSERRGDGQADVYRVAMNGSGAVAGSIEQLVASEGVDDAGALSPDGKMLAFTTSRYNQTSEIMLMNIATGHLTNLTLTDQISRAANPSQPNEYFKPTWSTRSARIMLRQHK